MLRQGKIVTCLAFGSAFIFAGLSLSFPASATDPSSSATATVHVSEACSLTSTILSPHNDSMGNGTYTDSLGSTKFTVKCNDASGFALYAIGYSGDQYGATSMLGDNELSIPTGTDASAGNTTSHWSMKISKDTTSYLPNSLTIENSFNSQHLIPSTYTKIASFPSSTDGINGTGTSILATYGVRISGTQAAGTYIGKVKYTLVHPNMNDNSNKPAEPLPACPANSICYAPNAADIVGSMSTLGAVSGSDKAGKVSATSNLEATLIAPNYSRPGYGFAGWSTDFEATSSSTIYGPNETITVPDVSSRGLILYPVWIAKETSVTMQTFNSTNYSAYSSAAIGTVIALEDTRDNNVYAVAKLADGKWWMIENLRLDNTATITTSNTHNPLHDANNNVVLKIDYDDNTTANHLAASNNTWCTIGGPCIDQTMLNTNNTNRNLAASYSGTGDTTYYQWYSYGNYYNWYSATAGNGTYSKSSGDVDGDLCPTGWHLPYGNSSGTGNTAGGFYYLNTLMSNDTSSQGSKDWRKFPNNFVYSGFFSDSSAETRSDFGNYWSSSASYSDFAYYLYFSSSVVSPGTFGYYKYYGRSVRCIAQ